MFAEMGLERSRSLFFSGCPSYQLPGLQQRKNNITVKICSSRSIGRQVFRSNGWNQHKFFDIFRKSGNFDFCFSIEIDPKSMNQKKLTSQSKPAHRDLQTGQKISPNGQNHIKFRTIFQKTCNLNFSFLRILYVFSIS